MIQEVNERLLAYGYINIPASLPEFSIYYRSSGDQLQVVHTITVDGDFSLTMEQHLHIKEQIRQMFQKKGYDQIEIFSLFVASKSERVKEICGKDTHSWTLDTASRRLLIYENQMSDFYGLRFILEDMLKSDEDMVKVDADSIIKKMKKKRVFPENLAYLNLTIVLVNIIVFLGLELTGSTYDTGYMIEKGALYPPYIVGLNQYYRLFTCMFMHFGIEHLASNMLVLYFLGDNVERALGKVKYFILYILSGLGGSCLSLLFALITGNNVVAAGASGAIFGVIGALFYIVIRNRGKLEDMTTGRVALLIGYSIFSGLTSEGIDNSAHIGGLIAGFLIAILLYRKKKQEDII